MRHAKRLLWLFLLLFSACHMFEDPDNVNPCPLNSAYPCACSLEASEGFCDDGSHCLADDDGFGICTWPCASKDQCEETQGWGIDTICDQTNLTATYCLVVCDHKNGGDGGYCPPGTTCAWVGGEDFAICETTF